MDATAQGILSALAYFDQFDFPLTREECWRWWYGARRDAPTREQVEAGLTELLRTTRAVETGGFVHLPGREPIVALRLERRERNRIKWRRARRAARWLQAVPFFRSLAVCNTVAISNGRPESDVDVFIVARAGRLWLTRALVTAVVSALGLRRHGHKVADRVCLSFYVSDAALDFRPLLLAPEDPYFAYWVAQLAPLYDPDDLTGAIRAKGSWVLDHVPNAFSGSPRARPPAASRTLRAVRQCLERLLGGRFGDWLEARARSVQRRKMASTARTAPGRRVVVTDDVLKFHEEDRRRQYNLRFARRREELLRE